jgi:hypothetical protein
MLSLGIQAFSQSEEVNLRIKQVENNLNHLFLLKDSRDGIYWIE